MLKDGTYAAWFKTPFGQGTAIAHVAHGKVWGRDGVMTFDGTCEVDGDRFTATIKTKKHTEGNGGTVSRRGPGGNVAVQRTTSGVRGRGEGADAKIRSGEAAET